MKVPIKPLYVPIEILARELDAAVLMGFLAAQRGITTFVGQEATFLSGLNHLPSGVYLTNDVASTRRWRNAMLSDAGHAIVSRDEEGVVHISDETFLRERINPVGLAAVQRLFLWGEHHAEVTQKAYPQLADRIRATGNSRMDLLRPRLDGYRERLAADLRRRYGRFLLFSSHFGGINIFHGNFQAFFDSFMKKQEADPATRAMYQDYFAFNKILFDASLEMLPRLARQCGELAIVVRPHPSENVSAWASISEGLPNLHVVREGSALEWMQASIGVLHCGCTVGLEAAVLGRPSVAYVPAESGAFHMDLPIAASLQARDFDEVHGLVTRIAAGRTLESTTEAAARTAIIARYIAEGDGRLACDRMLDEIEPLFADVQPTRSARLALFTARNTSISLLSRIQRRAPRSSYFAGSATARARELLDSYAACLPAALPVTARSLGSNAFVMSAGRSARVTPRLSSQPPQNSVSRSQT